jgi:hypothetical protein
MIYLLPAGGVVDDGADEDEPLVEPDGVVVVAPDPVELDPVVVSVERDGAVPGDADGVRSVPGRSPTRSLRSVQPVITAAPRARTNTALSNFAFGTPPPVMAPRVVSDSCNGSATYLLPLVH